MKAKIDHLPDSCKREAVNNSITAAVPAILEVKNLTKEYASGGGALTVVKAITFSIPDGSTRAIIGPSGSGKTTLLGICAGLDQPTSGEVHLDGVHLGALDE